MKHAATDEAVPARASALIRRQRVLLIITTVALMATVAGIVAAQFVKSPAQRAAEQAPPTPSLITAPVVLQKLTQQITVRGTVEVSHTVTLTCRQTVSPAILTRLPVASGTKVTNGSLLAEVSGVPIFVMQGNVPAYRTLSVGDKGADVRQLQAALKQLGYLPKPSGTYDKATQNGVAAMYKKHGYANPDELAFGSIVFTPTLPAVVGTLSHQVGDDVGGQPLLTLLAGAPVVRATIPAGQQADVAAGQSVSINDEANQRSGTGKVESIGAFAPSQQADDPNASVPGYPVTVSALAGVDTTWVGAQVAVTIVTGSTPGPVLVVPLAAVQSDGGRTFVVVSDAGSTHDVTVTTGMVADGRVEVTPAEGATLAADDQVVVG